MAFNFCVIHADGAHPSDPEGSRPGSADRFPTHESLRRANNKRGETTLTFDSEGVAEPRPLWRKKEDVLVLANVKDLDDRACMVSKSV